MANKLDDKGLTLELGFRSDKKALIEDLLSGGTNYKINVDKFPHLDANLGLYLELYDAESLVDETIVVPGSNTVVTLPTLSIGQYSILRYKPDGDNTFYLKMPTSGIHKIFTGVTLPISRLGIATGNNKGWITPGDDVNSYNDAPRLVCYRVEVDSSGLSNCYVSNIVHRASLGPYGEKGFCLLSSSDSAIVIYTRIS